MRFYSKKIPYERLLGVVKVFDFIHLLRFERLLEIHGKYNISNRNGNPCLLERLYLAFAHISVVRLRIFHCIGQPEVYGTCAYSSFR